MMFPGGSADWIHITDALPGTESVCLQFKEDSDSFSPICLKKNCLYDPGQSDYWTGMACKYWF